jgi:nicotinamidase-related amidase
MNNSLRLKKQDTASVIIDVQEKLFPLIHEHEQIAKNMSILIQGLKVLEVPILVTQQYTKGLGGTIKQISDAIGDYSHIEKMAFSCCGDEGFMNQFKKLNKKNVILAGIEAHVCVLQTALDLLDAGYRPIVIEDCVSSRFPVNKQVAIERMRLSGAVISTFESILFELTEVSGTDLFKSIVKLVK